MNFSRTADSICDEETNYLFGPETLIVQQIDERNPSASPYYRQLLDFSGKIREAQLPCGGPQLSKNWGGCPTRESFQPGRRLLLRGLQYRPFSFTRIRAPNSITRPSWSPCSSACLLCNISASLENIPWNLADITAPTAFVRKPVHLCPPILPLAFCLSSVLSRRLVSTVLKICRKQRALSA